MVCQLILRKWYFLTRKVKRRFPDYANYLLCNHWFHIFIEVSCWERVKGLPTENCPNCLYFNISYFPVETPFQVYPKKIKKFQVCSKRNQKSVPSVFMISAGGKIDKNLAIVGFKKSYYLNIPLQKSSKNPKYSKKTQKYSIFDQILEIFNQNWPFSHWTGNLDIFKAQLRGRVVGVNVWVWFRRDFHDSNLEKSFKSIHDRAEIIFNHDFESNRPCNWIWSPASYDLPVCHELNQKALIESRNAFELFLISSDPIRSILITNRSRPITRWDLESEIG